MCVCVCILSGATFILYTYNECVDRIQANRELKDVRDRLHNINLFPRYTTEVKNFCLGRRAALQMSQGVYR